MAGVADPARDPGADDVEADPAGDEPSGARRPAPNGGVFQEPLAVLRVLGGDPCFAQPLEVPLDPLAQNETAVAGELVGVVARPEYQVVSLGDRDQFLVFFP
jgi:hypothetical protein